MDGGDSGRSLPEVLQGYADEGWRNRRRWVTRGV